jgi:restriction system protein
MQMKATRNYYRIYAGQKSVYAQLCREQGFIGADWGIHQDLTNKLPDEWKHFNHQFIPIYLEANPEKSKVAAGLACGMLHTVSKGMLKGDIVLCPNGAGGYYVGEVASEYFYHAEGPLQHRRKINWYEGRLLKGDMSKPLKNSMGSIGTLSNISKYAEELDSLIEGKKPPALVHADEDVEDPSVFALEKHLEDFLVANWQSTVLGQHYDIFTEEGEAVGQQYPSDTGPIDILAISKDQKTLLIVELKKGRASDVVIGQIQRYMGYVKDELAESNQTVKGVIIALEDDLRLKRALSVTNNIEFYRYQVSFSLHQS